MFTCMLVAQHLCFRNGTSQYRAAPHALSYNAAENAILLCSVSSSVSVVCGMTRGGGVLP